MTFIGTRINRWAADPAGAGLTPGQVVQLQELLEESRSARLHMLQLRAAAKGATLVFYSKTDALRSAASAAVASVRAAARTDSHVFVEALIDPPKAPTPAHAPDAPRNVRGAVDANGHLTLEWDADRTGVTSGVFFLIERSRPGEQPFAFLGATPSTTFTDTAFTAGTTYYRVRAQRGDLLSEWSSIVSMTVAPATRHEPIAKPARAAA
jgi:hypothetical protein